MSDTAIIGESVPYQMETQIQFENGPFKPMYLEEYLLKSPVAQAKAGILNMQLFPNVTDQPKDLVLCVILPDDIHDGSTIEMVLDESRYLQEYLDEISCCQGMKLKKK